MVSVVIFLSSFFIFATVSIVICERALESLGIGRQTNEWNDKHFFLTKLEGFAPLQNFIKKLRQKESYKKVTRYKKATNDIRDKQGQQKK